MSYFINGQITPFSPTNNSPDLTYQRPVDWLPMPEVEATEERVVALLAVYNVIGNFVALQFEGDYTVDWGDGTVEDFASGVKAQHSYDYATIGNETLCSRGYKQVLIEVTPQVGQNLTLVNLNIFHDNVSILGDLVLSSVPWLDITVSCPNATSLLIAQPTIFPGPIYRETGHDLLEIFTLVTSGLATDLDYLLRYCISLQQVNFLSLPNVESLSGTFYYCSQLQQVSFLNLPLVGDTTDLFSYCNSLRSVSFAGLPSLVVAEYMFYECYALPYVSFPPTPLLDNTDYMFEYCYNLEKAEFSDLSSLTSAYDMFYECYNLKSIVVPPTPLLEDVNYMFEYCTSLKTVVFSDLPSLGYIDSGTFYQCSGLESVVFPNTSSLTYFTYPFEYCYNLRSIVFNDLSALTTAEGFSYECYSLQGVTLPALPLLDSAYYMFYSSDCLLDVSLPASNITNLDFAFFDSLSLRSVAIEDCSLISSTLYSFDQCPALSAVSLPNIAVSFSVNGCALSAEAIISLFNDLGTASATIDVGGNYGAADLTPGDIAIATGKGWTVLT